MYYETVIIVNPDVSQENTQTLTDSLVERIEKAAGRIVKREYWGSRPLAYQIEKRKRGHYVLLVTDGEPAAVAALEHALRLEERVMRFLTTRISELSEEPSPLMRRTEPAKTEVSAEAPDETKAAEKDEATEAPAESKAKPKSPEPKENVSEAKAAEAVKETRPAKQDEAAASEAKAEKAKATDMTSDETEEEPAEAEKKKSPAKKAAASKAKTTESEEKDAPSEKKKAVKAKKAEEEAND